MSTNKSGFPLMENMTVKQVREYLKSKKSVIIPLGVIEQHGYHLPLKTDALIAGALGRIIGEKTGIMVAPVMHQSFSGGDCPGTINISPATMSLVVSDMLVSFAKQGIRKFYLLLCHGGSENARALDNALKLLLRNNPVFEKVMIVLMPVWKLNSKNIGWSKAFSEGDWHAGWLETSMVMALAPDLVRVKDIRTDKPALLKMMIKHPDNYQHAQKIVDDEFVIARLKQRPEIEVGVMGYPERASRKTGQALIADMVKNACSKINYLEKKADGRYREVKFTPEPIMLT